MVRRLKIAGAAALALGAAGCNTALPPGTLVQPGYAPPPPVYAPPPPPPRCYFRDGPYGPERVCARPYY